MPALTTDFDVLPDQRIDVREDRDIAYWTEALSVSEEQLRRTVAEVGDRVADLCERIPH